MSRTFFLLAPIATTAGCLDSGQTGSPAAPTYDSFSPPVNGTGGADGNPAVRTCDNNNPTQLRYATDFAKVFGNYLVVVAEPAGAPTTYATPQSARERGLLIYDLRAPGKPVLVGELMLEGSPRALLVDDSGVASVVMSEDTKFDSSRLPEAPLPTFANHLIRVDLSDPTTPRIVADVLLEDDFWTLKQVGSRLHVLGGHWEVIEPSCSIAGAGLGLGVGAELCPTGTLQLTTYQATGTELQFKGKKDVGGDGYWGFVTDGGYVTVRSGLALTAAWVEPSDGSVQVTKTLDYDGPVRVAALNGAVLAVVVDDPTEGSQLRLYRVAAGEVPSELGRVMTTTPVDRLSFLPDATALLLEAPSVGGVAALVDIRDPSQPKVSSLSGAREAAVVGGALVGLGPNDSGKVVVSLWDTTNLAAPQQIRQLETNTPYVTNYVMDRPRWTVPEAAGLLLYPTLTPVPDGSMIGSLLVVRAAPGSLEVVAERTALGDMSRPLNDGAYTYGISEGVFAVVPFDSATAVTTVELRPQPKRFVIEEQVSGNKTVRLVREGEALFVEVQASDSDPVRLPLPHFAEALRIEGNRAVALGLRRDSLCASATSAETAGLSCPVPNQAGITVISLGDMPSIDTTILLPTDLDTPEIPGSGTATSASWCGYVSLGDGRLVLPVSRVISCSSVDACNRLGLEVSERMATDGCSTVNSNCNPNSYVIYSAAEAQSFWYVLDLNAYPGPTLLPGVKLEGTTDVGSLVANVIPCTGPLDMARNVLVSGTTLGLTTTEPRTDPSGNALQTAQGDVVYRTWLHLLSVGTDGSVTWKSRVNVPGTPIALRDEGALAYTVASEYVDSTHVNTLLHRMSLRDRGAYVERTIALGGRSHGRIALDGRGFFIQGPAALCTESPATNVFSINLDDEELVKGPALSLPQDNWKFAPLQVPWDKGSLVLTGGPLYSHGRLLLNVSDAEAAPSVVRYHSFEK